MVCESESGSSRTWPRFESPPVRLPGNEETAPKRPARRSVVMGQPSLGSEILGSVAARQCQSQPGSTNVDESAWAVAFLPLEFALRLGALPRRIAYWRVQGDRDTARCSNRFRSAAS